MPHISKRVLKQQTKEHLDKTLLSLILDTGSKQRLLLLQELLTKTELLMIAKRLGMILLLEQGLSTYKISQILGVSHSTALRFNLYIEQNRYKNSTRWIQSKRASVKFEKALENLVKLAFTGKTKSLKEVLDET